MLFIYFGQFADLLRSEAELFLFILTRKNKEGGPLACGKVCFWTLCRQKSESALFLFFAWQVHAFLLQSQQLIFDFPAVEDVSNMQLESPWVLY